MASGGDHGHDLAPTSSNSIMVSRPPRRQSTMENEECPAASPFQRHKLRRGLSVDQVQQWGIISPLERSVVDFEDIPLSDEEIGAQPRKLRPYYRKLQAIHEHYEEVDGLLSGELLSIIADSFQPPNSRIYLSDPAYVQASREEWQRRHSAWHIRPPKRSITGDTITPRNYIDESSPLLGGARQAHRDRQAALALNVNTVVNVLLVAVKAVAVYYSSSISLMASLVDSALDMLSTFIILGTSWAMGIEGDRRAYPTGKRRFEPLGVLIFSVVMIASFVQVLIQSVQQLLSSKSPEPVELSAIGLGSMLATIAVKSVLWVWCSSIPSSAVQALAQDAENDVWLNIMSLAFPWLGEKVGSALLDPIGGIVLSSYIIFEWIKTLSENFRNLSGRAAGGDQITRVLYMVTRFNPVLDISDVEVYHIGDDLIVEVEVVLPQSTSLHVAHDVGETIQCMLENLDGVVRAYVHIDYSSSNPSQHTNRTPARPGQAIPPHEEPSELMFAGSATPRASNPIRMSIHGDAPQIPGNPT